MNKGPRASATGRFYETGKMCLKGHVAKRYTRTGTCVTCQRDQFKVRVRAERIRDPRRFMIHQAKVRAKRDGVPFGIAASDIPIPTCCPILGIPLRTATGKPTDNSPTLDKIIPRLGYVIGNVAVISHRANRLKGDATFLEVVLLAKWLERVT